jgi:AcrR family transcriptional regulator
MMRKRIVDTARWLFQLQGVKTISLDDIAHELSISKKTIYEHFRNKEEIADEVMKTILEESLDTIKSIRNNGQDPRGQVVEVVKWIEEVIRITHPLFLEDLKKHFFKTYINFRNQLDSKFIKAFANILDEGKKKKQFRKELNSILIAKYCIELLRNEIRNKDSDYDEKSIRDVLNYFISGISTKKEEKY